MMKRPMDCLEPCAFAARLLGNDVLTDECGMGQTVVPVPRMWTSDVVNGSPKKIQEAFLVDHDEKGAFWVAKYPMAWDGGALVSVPGEKPAEGLTFDQALAACYALGDGWHLLTNAEWAAISLRCRASAGGYPAAGQAHDGTVGGICGLGDGMAWVGGARVMDGEIQIIAHNNAAITGIDQGSGSDQWRSVSAQGQLLLPGHAQSLKVGFAAAGVEAPVLLKALALDGLGSAGMKALPGEMMIVRGETGKGWDSTPALLPRNACRRDVRVYAAYLPL